MPNSNSNSLKCPIPGLDDQIELPSKRRLVSYSEEEINLSLVVAVHQPCQKKGVFSFGNVVGLGTHRQFRCSVIRYKHKIL